MVYSARQGISKLEELSLPYGTIAANGGLVYLLLRKPGVSRLYAIFTLMLVYLGMLLGSLSVYTLEMVLWL